MRAASILDDVIQVATDWKNDGELKYDREDYVDFVRGNTLLMSGDRAYSAIVLAEITSDGRAIFHDLEDIYPDSFELKKSESSTAVSANELPNYVLEDSDAENVAQKGTDVKGKFSVSDSDGKKLTKEQQEYFKDSKMRDENGNLKVMYHGSQDAGFHVFNSSMSDDDYCGIVAMLNALMYNCVPDTFCRVFFVVGPKIICLVLYLDLRYI